MAITTREGREFVDLVVSEHIEDTSPSLIRAALDALLAALPGGSAETAKWEIDTSDPTVMTVITNDSTVSVDPLDPTVLVMA